MNEGFQEPEYWDSQYRSGETPWEISHVPAQLVRWIGAHAAGGAVLIPGCGAGREISTFANAGWNVTAIDFAPAAIERARKNSADVDATFVLGDFFTHPFALGEFDLICERTFLTALSPARWPACVARYRDLLKPGGRVVAYCSYGCQPDGPPFLQPTDKPPVFAAAFRLEEDAASRDALPLFGERERWQVWRKNDE